MPAKIIEEHLRDITTEDIQNVIGTGPDVLLESAAQYVEANDGVVLQHDEFPGWLAIHLRQVTPGIVAELASSAWAPVVSSGPTFEFIEPVPSFVTAKPMRIDELSVTHGYASFLEIPSIDIQSANEALKEIEEFGFQVQFTVSEPERSEQVATMGNLFARIVKGARSFPIVDTRPPGRVLPLTPGRMPALIEDAAASFITQLRLGDTYNRQKLELLSTVVAAEGQSDPATPLHRLSEVYKSIQDKFKNIADIIDESTRRLQSGETGVPWWLEGGMLLDKPEFEAGDLKSGAGEHLVVPELPSYPGIPTQGVPEQNRQYPIALCLSDLHIGQGTRIDNADDVYLQLDRALIKTIGLWSARVRLHRASVGLYQPAYLVLHGDVLDTWSADMIPDSSPSAGANQFIPDNDRSSNPPTVTGAIAKGRVKRIFDAHSRFFDAITQWVNENTMNFVIYVCGNHDDHLWRFNLGEEVATRLHKSRGAFASDSLTLPHMRVVIEHGHRQDHFNTKTSIGSLGSLGELVVAMMINPVERGGANYILQTDATPGSNYLEAHGIDPDDIGELRGAYNAFREAWEVNPQLYEWMLGSVDNLDDGGLEEVVADLGGRKLVWANPSGADDADVSDLDDVFDDLKNLWLTDDFQDLREHVAARLSKFMSPSMQTHLVNEVFASNHAKELGFEPGLGLFGSSSMKIHVVGHTHKPQNTAPPLNGQTVSAQHVNTGTGQDTWSAEDTSYPWDEFDLSPSPLAVKWSRDQLRPVQRSHFCILRKSTNNGFEGVFVEGGPYRSLQTLEPTNVNTQAITVRLAGPSNFVMF